MQKPLITLFLLLAFTIRSSAQQGYNYMVHFVTEESQNDEKITAIAFDDRKNLIIGSRNGISIFDGLQQSRIPNTPSGILCLKSDSTGTVFVGAKNDFGYLKRNAQGRVKYVSLKISELQTGSISHIIQFKDKLIFFGEQSIFFVNTEMKITDRLHSKDYGEFTGLFTRNDELYVNVKNHGIHFFENGKLSEFKAGTKFKNRAIRFFAPYNAHSILLGTDDNRIYIFNGRSFKQFSENTDVRGFLEENVLWDGLRFTEETFMLSTLTGGIIFIDRIYGKIQKTVNYQSGLPDDEISAVALDRENRLWLAHSEGLTCYTAESPVKDYSHYPGLYGKVNDVLFRNDTLLVATNNGVYRLSEIKNYREKQIMIKEKAKYGYKFTPKQTYVLQSVSHKYRPISGLEEKIKQLWMLNDSTLTGISDYGIYEIRDTIAVKRVKDLYINDFTADPDTQIIYVAGLKGLYSLSFRYDSTKADVVWKKSKLFEHINEEVSSVAMDNAGRLFFGMDGKAFMAEKDTSARYQQTTEIGFPINLNEAVNVKFTDGNIYFFQSQGVFRYNPSGNLAERDTAFKADNPKMLLEAAEQKNRSPYFLSKPTDSDFPNIGLLKLFPQIRSIRKDAQNNVWLVNGSRSLYKISPDSSLYKPEKFEVYIVSVRDKKDSLYIPEDPYFEYDRNAVKIELSAPSYISNAGTEFRYKIKGLDNYEDLSDWTSNPQIELSFIPPGNYTLFVEARNILGDITPAKQMEFSVAVPFTQTELFYFIVSGSALAIFLALLFIGRYRLKLKNRKLEKIIAERTAEIREQNQRLETQKEEISAQRDLLAERNSEIETQRDELAEKNTKIEKQNKNITASITYASSIQQAILPTGEQINTILPNNFIYYKPRDIVSGDFYWFAQRNDSLYFAAADCTGHGVPGAFMSMLGVSFLNNIVNTSRKKDLMPADILNELTDRVIEALHQTGDPDEAKDGMDIALCKIDPKTGKAAYSGAFNPMYMVWNDEVRVFQPNRRPIGIYEFMHKVKPFDNEEFEVRKGDMLYVFSDGYVDQFGGQKGRKFNLDRFKDLLLKVHKLPLEKQKAELDKVMQRWMKDEDQLDDMLVMGVRI